MFYWEDRDQYIDDLEELCEIIKIEVEQDKWDDQKIYRCYAMLLTSIDADQLLQSSLENDFHEDAYDCFSEESIKELQKLLDDWCNKYGHLAETWYPKYRSRVEIDWETGQELLNCENSGIL